MAPGPRTEPQRRRRPKGKGKASQWWFVIRHWHFGHFDVDFESLKKEEKSTQKRLETMKSDIIPNPKQRRSLRDRIRHFTPSWFALVMGPSLIYLIPVSYSFLRNWRTQLAHPKYPIWHTSRSLVGRISILRPQRHPFLHLPHNVDYAVHVIPRNMEPNASSSCPKPIPCLLPDGFCYPHQRVSILVLH